MDVEILKKIPFFAHFCSESLRALSPFFRKLQFKQGDVILAQDGLNTELLFLIEGPVDIHIDQQYIVTIHSYGEVFGEMSIAGHTTCSADVIANTDCKMIALDYQRLQDIDLAMREKIEYYLYKSCAEVLAKKLIDTNELAKTFKAMS